MWVLKLYINTGEYYLNMSIAKLGLTLAKKCTRYLKPTVFSGQKCCTGIAQDSLSLFCTSAWKNIKAAASGKNIEAATPEPNIIKSFCTYFKSIIKGKASSDKTIVKTHHDLVLINRYLNGLKSNISSGKQKMPINCPFKGTVDEFIKTTDAEFKELAPIGKKMTLYRAIFNTAKDKNSAEYLALLKRQKSLKSGDKFVMRGYAYSTPHNTNNPYIESPDTSIIYQIEVPKGARISHDGFGEFIFPRYSACEVIDNTLTKNGINIIKSRYILPQG